MYSGNQNTMDEYFDYEYHYEEYDKESDDSSDFNYLYDDLIYPLIKIVVDMKSNNLPIMDKCNSSHVVVEKLIEEL